ncbi:MAG: alanine--tRNA ligase [Acidobacteriia bacterium]|nr:alanine--tRNA ligase [Terriglobia bacterium]
MLSGNDVRRKFLDYFVQRGHKEVHSSSLVPANDPTLLFTNAGMNQFKDVFLGLEKRDYNRATTSQKCVRAGGKHNDLENVGFTNRHHTFFEMLGNFSFGDYFKREAIAYAWELITSPEWYAIPKDKLYATIFKGEGVVPRDEEAYNLWHEQGVPKERIYEFGLKDNFWQMGDTGPCGPCSEIHYDMGPAASDQAHTDCKFGCECGRYVEIWNLVFMQFDRDTAGVLNPLPKPSIDTGAGLERLAAVLQGKLSNYDTDLFVPLIGAAAGMLFPDSNKTPLSDILSGSEHQASLRIIADHSRATTFLISDGVVPSNEGRGYVLRKIMRRAIRHGRLLRHTQPFLYKMVHEVTRVMCDAYSELKESVPRVAETVLQEEKRFSRTVDEGLKRLDADLAPLIAERHLSARPEKGLEQLGLKKEAWGTLEPRSTVVYSGEKAFKLYDTFGLPLDFIQDACRDGGIVLDSEGFDRAMAEQRTRAQASWKGAAKQTASPVYTKFLDEFYKPEAVGTGKVDGKPLNVYTSSFREQSVFVGYKTTEASGCEILALIRHGQGVQELKKGEQGEVILDQTPFYAESGGQVADRGWLYSPGRGMVVAEVESCYYPVQGVRAHYAIAREDLRVGDRVDAAVDTEKRWATMRHHTATHLLHAGLRQVLGPHVKQAGSLVSPGRLRFDFSHFVGVEDEELQEIEDIVNKEVLRNQKVEVIEDVPIDVAINEYKAMALFGEKYGDRVRVVKVGDFSTELCGGTHTSATGEIGLIKILDEGSVSSGVRRVEAVAGESSLRHFRADHELEHVARTLVRGNLTATIAGTSRVTAHLSGSGKLTATIAGTSSLSGSLATALRHEITARDDEIKRLKKELEQARMKSAAAGAASIEDKVRVVNGVKVLAHRADNLERAQMRTLVDNLRQKLGSGVVVVGSASNGTVALVAGVTKDLTTRVQAGKVIGPVAEKVGGKGGGRPDLAEAGGKDAAALDEALGSVYAVVESLLK